MKGGGDKKRKRKSDLSRRDLRRGRRKIGGGALLKSREDGKGSLSGKHRERGILLQSHSLPPPPRLRVSRLTCQGELETTRRHFLPGGKGRAE